MSERVHQRLATTASSLERSDDCHLAGFSLRVLIDDLDEDRSPMILDLMYDHSMESQGYFIDVPVYAERLPGDLPVFENVLDFFSWLEPHFPDVSPVMTLRENVVIISLRAWCPSSTNTQETVLQIVQPMMPVMRSCQRLFESFIDHCLRYQEQELEDLVDPSAVLDATSEARFEDFISPSACEAFLDAFDEAPCRPACGPAE